MCSPLKALLATILVLAMVPATAAAAPRHADSDAPAGAAVDWLPNEEWVMERWLPFDETRLASVLGMDFWPIYEYVKLSGKTLNDLARRQKVPTKGLAARVLGPRPAGITQRVWSQRRARTARVLRQSHLSEHMLGHNFHQWAIIHHTSENLGVTQSTFTQMYCQLHASFAEIAASGGLSGQQVRARTLPAAAAAGRKGVRKGAMSVEENKLLRWRDQAQFDGWFAYRVP